MRSGGREGGDENVVDRLDEGVERCWSYDYEMLYDIRFWVLFRLNEYSCYY